MFAVLTRFTTLRPESVLLLHVLLGCIHYDRLDDILPASDEPYYSNMREALHLKRFVVVLALVRRVPCLRLLFDIFISGNYDVLLELELRRFFF